MRRSKRKMQSLAVIMSMFIMLLSACGSEVEQAEEVTEVAADIAEVKDETESEVSETAEDVGEEEGKEEEAEPEEIEEEPLAVVPYSEENKLEFYKDLTIPVKAVRIDINDKSVYEEVDAECVIKDVSIEDAEDGFKTITIKYEVIGEVFDSYEKRLLQTIMPNAAYCDLNTGELHNIDGNLFDNEETEKITIEWNGRTYEIELTRIVEWSSKPNWKSDGKNGYVSPITMYVTDSFVVPKDYDGMGMVIGMFTAEETYSGEYEMFGDTQPFILEVLESRKDARLYSINELFQLFSEDEVVADDVDTKVNTDKSGTASSNNSTSKENTNNSSSKDNTTPKREQPAHTHSYNSSVTKNPSCGENGVMTYTCSCGSSYTEAIPASGHQWVTIIETVSHPSTGHYENVTRKEIWCGCGFTCTTQAELNAHAESGVCDYGNCGVTEWTDNVWVVDSEGWTENINVTKCAVCGAQG